MQGSFFSSVSCLKVMLVLIVRILTISVASEIQIIETPHVLYGFFHVGFASCSFAVVFATCGGIWGGAVH